MSVIEWLAGGGLITLIGLSVFLWLRAIQDDRFRGEMRQALLGYEGRGGIMADLESVKNEVGQLRARIETIVESLRQEIADSRHLLRSELEAKIEARSREAHARITSVEDRVREIERMRGT